MPQFTDKKKCVNCGRNETDKTICDSCRNSFPGTPEMLEEMIETFRSMSKMFNPKESA